MPPQPKNQPQYKPVAMSTRTVVSGGYCEKDRAYPVMTKDVEDVLSTGETLSYTFCRVSKSEPWIVKAAVPGGTGGRRSLFNLQIFDNLEKAISKTGETNGSEPEDSQETDGKPPGKKRRKRAVENVHVIQMHETYMDPSVPRLRAPTAWQVALTDGAPPRREVRVLEHPLGLMFTTTNN